MVFLLGSVCEKLGPQCGDGEGWGDLSEVGPSGKVLGSLGMCTWKELK